MPLINKKTVLVTCISLVLNLICTIGVFFIAPKLMPQNTPADMSLLVILFFVFIPAVSIITGILGQVLLKKMWASSVITLITVLIGSSVSIAYLPAYLLLSLIASALTCLVIKLKHQIRGSN